MPAAGEPGVPVAENAAMQPTGILRVGSRGNRLVRFGLACATGLAVALAWVGLLQKGAWGVDLSIILDATERWLAGGSPYVPGAVTDPDTFGLPMLQPPYFLVAAAPLTFLPRVAVLVTWILLLAVVAAVAVRRTGVRGWWLAAVLAWPPVAEGVVTGNVQVVSFAAFAALFWAGSRGGAEVGEGGSTLRRSRRPMVDGLLGASIIALKVSQVQAWSHVLGRRPMAAIAAATCVALGVLITVIVTGPQLWSDWVAQLSSASSAGVVAWGYSVVGPLDPPLQALLIGASVIAAMMVRGPRAAVIVGLLFVIASPSLRMHGLVYLVPAMLFVRREIAMVGALLISLYLPALVWAGIALITGTAIAAIRLEGLREPPPA
jgi:hypothetical protein